MWMWEKQAAYARSKEHRHSEMWIIFCRQNTVIPKQNYSLILFFLFLSRSFSNRVHSKGYRNASFNRITRHSFTIWNAFTFMRFVCECERMYVRMSVWVFVYYQPYLTLLYIVHRHIFRACLFSYALYYYFFFVYYRCLYLTLFSHFFEIQNIKQKIHTNTHKGKTRKRVKRKSQPIQTHQIEMVVLFYCWSYTISWCDAVS